MKKGIFIFDIDGTVADMSHRLHYIQGWNKDYDKFYGSVSEDKPIEDVIDILRLLFLDHHRIIFMTGRSEVCREDTIKWIRKHIYHGNKDINIELHMRPSRDWRPDTTIKMEMWYGLDESIRSKVKGVFEDRNSVVEMWRGLGVRCYQVKEGEY